MWPTFALKWGSILVALALLVVFGYYIYIVLVRHTPDFRRDGYPDTRPPFYVTFYGDWDPGGGGFAFPRRGGWKAVGALYAQGVLQGSYRANEESITTSWYTRQAPWCGKSPPGSSRLVGSAVAVALEDGVRIAVQVVGEDLLVKGARAATEGGDEQLAVGIRG